VTLVLAVFAEVICPVVISLGWMTRLATSPVLFLLLVSMLLVHPEWSIAEGQFGWLLIIHLWHDSTRRTWPLLP